MENSMVKDIEEIINKNIKVTEINGETYSNQQLHLIRNEDEAVTIEFNDLSSIIAMVKQELKKFDLPLFINIKSETRIEVFSAVALHKNREIPYYASCNNRNFRFGSYYNYEDFIIALRSQFVQNKDSVELLELLKKVTNSNIVETEDDGITQKITASSGASLCKTVQSAPIRSLAPYRTFNEVEQPTSEFLFRVKEGGSYALFEADGGAWQKQAKLNIREYFEKQFVEEISQGQVVIVS